MTAQAERIDAISNADGLAREGLEFLDRAIALVVEEAFSDSGSDPGDMQAALRLMADARVALRQIRKELDQIEDSGPEPEQPAVPS